MTVIAEAGAYAVVEPDPAPDEPPQDFIPEVPTFDPTIWPEPPPWLFPLTMTFTFILVAVVLVLLGMWWKSVRIAKAERAAAPEPEWVDLSKLVKGGRWLDEDDQSGGKDSGTKK